MFTAAALKALLASPLFRSILKYFLMIMAIISVVYGIYAYGHSKGHDEGYKAGWAAQQETIDGLVKQINDEREAQQKKLDKIQADAAEAILTAQKEAAAAKKERDDILSNYQHNTPPEQKHQCGLNVSAVNAINALLGTQLSYSNMDLPEDFTLPVIPLPVKPKPADTPASRGAIK